MFWVRVTFLEDASPSRAKSALSGQRRPRTSVIALCDRPSASSVMRDPPLRVTSGLTCGQSAASRPENYDAGNWRAVMTDRL